MRMYSNAMFRSEAETWRIFHMTQQNSRLSHPQWRSQPKNLEGVKKFWGGQNVWF